MFFAFLVAYFGHQRNCCSIAATASTGLTIRICHPRNTLFGAKHHCCLQPQKPKRKETLEKTVHLQGLMNNFFTRKRMVSTLLVSPLEDSLLK